MSPARYHFREDSLRRRWRSTGSAVARALCAIALLSLLFSPLLALVARADSYDERRVRTGARLFRSLLAADTGLEAKADKGELLVLVYSTDARLGQTVASLLMPESDPAHGAIRGLKLKIQQISTLPVRGGQPQPVGLFLASAPPAGQISALVQWSVASRTIVFSPFEGHVELGITAGLAIEAKVQPYLNAKTVQATGLALKPFFLKVAKVYR